MILSVSRRTDIPAFYGDWFMERIRQGFVMVRNPMNKHQVSRIPLSNRNIECIVFWTKNPQSFIRHLSNLQDWNYYFQFTLTSYNHSIEANVPKKQEVLDTFIKLSSLVGRHRVIWRYDPILLTDQIDVNYHIKYFEYIAKRLAGHTEKCVISFVDMYSKCQRNMKKANIRTIEAHEKRTLARAITGICSSHNLVVETCSEDVDLAEFGIEHGKCIDDKLIERIIGFELQIEKDKTQREICGCVSSIDIGEYNTCQHNCLYCYANFSKKAVEYNVIKHKVDSPILVGNVDDSDKITDRKIETFIRKQRRIF